jgi:hypothetical protein
METAVKVYRRIVGGVELFSAKVFMFGLLVHETATVDDRRAALGDAREWLMVNT